MQAYQSPGKKLCNTVLILHLQVHIDHPDSHLSTTKQMSLIKLHFNLLHSLIYIERQRQLFNVAALTLPPGHYSNSTAYCYNSR